MIHTSHVQSISWVQEQYRAARLELRPPFQRKFVWTDKQRSFLIESILINVPIPEIYVQVTQTSEGTEEFGVVDGQQRLRTILQFIGIESGEDQEQADTNLFALDALPSTSIYKGKVFADLDADERRRFFGYQISMRYLHTDNSKDVEDVFKRLNSLLSH